MTKLPSFFRRLTPTLISSALLLSATLVTAKAQTQSLALSPNTTQHTSSTPPALTPPAPELAADAYVVMDAKTGKMLAQKNSDRRLPPASLTKMMTLYLVFSALQNGQIQLGDKVRISKKAWQMSGSRMFVGEGARVTVDQLIQGVVVASGNDACVALAEYIGGTEKTFAELMNQTANRLNLTDSHFVDSTGLPNPKHYTTPRDMARLAQALLRDFPEYYHFFDLKWLTYNHIKQPNRNRLLWRDPSVDGIKTGHTKAAGYCLVASAKQNDMRLITVIMGAPSDSARSNNAQALLNYGFRFYKTYPIFPANQAITKSRVWLGKEKYAALGFDKPVYVSIPSTEYGNLKANVTLNERLVAPVTKGQVCGKVDVTLHNETIASKPLVALQTDPQSGFFARTIDHLIMLIKG